ncbi:MAG: hypothetical protein HY840_06560 [Bacteroidetes bacterium]|nr:hypothetical protein [Bacteroidota bacterium]
MFKNLSYKNKNKLLLAGVVLLVFIAYSFVIKDTLVLYGDCADMTSKLEMASDAPVKAAMVQKKIDEMNGLLGTHKEQGDEVQQDLLGTVTGFCQKNNILLKEFPKAIVNTEKDFTVETNIFTVEGSFAKLLDLVYLLEQKSRIGKVASVRFLTRVDIKTKTLFLTAKVYFQNARKIENENQK